MKFRSAVLSGPGTLFSPATVTVAPGEAVIWSFQAFHTSTSDTATGLEGRSASPIPTLDPARAVLPALLLAGPALQLAIRR